ncbi:hypothetical protein J4E00_14980 [Siccationidurans soli]|uniref:XRE family transcriptional regulator n=1 Tax=Hymenobacter negativus TaxID=2795026 RepID=A0ABS3QGH5_9BACT|nr:hypothetical protein [Hymenobacter negativus]
MPSNSLAAAVRAHFGLTQAELGRYLGVAREQVAFVEAGKRSFALGAERRLRQLVLLLPPEGESVPPATPAAEVTKPLTATELLALRKRLRRCRHEATQLRYQLETEADRTQAQTRRQRSLAHLRAGLLPATGALTAEEERARDWLARLAPTPVHPPLLAGAQGLLVARLQGLTAEANALEEQLAVNSGKLTENQR